MAYTTINKSTDNFTPFTFSGTGQSSVTGVGFTPDMFIHKNRGNTQSWGVIDVIRGNGNYLGTNSTNAQLSDVNNYGIASDGYTFPNADQFFNSGNMVYWNWKAGGTVSNNNNNDGQGYSTVSANTTAGFSIVKYTGTGSNTNFGHGLGVAPKVIIIKRLDSADQWIMYHNSIGNTGGMYPNLTNSVVDNDTWFNDTSPTSSVFYVGSNSKVNASSGSYIAYCFAEKTGYSKFGSYTGNGNANGTFIYTGFKPAWVYLKNTQQGGDHWYIWDNKRSEYNQTQKYLGTSRNNAEADSSSYAIDMLSNGFKIRSSTGAINNNGEKLIYMTIGQSLVGLNNVPCTAR